MLVSCSADGSGLSSQSTSNKSHSPASRDFVCLRLGKQSEFSKQPGSVLDSANPGSVLDHRICKSVMNLLHVLARLNYRIE